MILIFIALGLFVGFIAGLFGVGGGLIVVPFLVFMFNFLHFPQETQVQIAIGTSLAAMVFTSASSAFSHFLHGKSNWRYMMILAPGIILGTVFGAVIAHNLPGTVIKVIFVIFCETIGILYLWPRKVAFQFKLPFWLLGFFSIMIGMTSSVLGIGGGMMTVPLLNAFYLSMKDSISISAKTGFLIASFGALSFFVLGMESQSQNPWGYIYLPAALSIGISASLMAPIGAKTAHSLPVESLKKYFGVLLMIMGVLIFVK
jgi:uncharacterized membrane protein YfcA